MGPVELILTILNETLPRVEQCEASRFGVFNVYQKFIEMRLHMFVDGSTRPRM